VNKDISCRVKGAANTSQFSTCRPESDSEGAKGWQRVTGVEARTVQLDTVQTVNVDRVTLRGKGRRSLVCWCVVYVKLKMKYVTVETVTAVWLKSKAFSGMTPCHLMSTQRRLEESYCPRLQSQAVQYEGNTVLRTSGTTRPTTRRHIPHHLNLQQ
jgi:hypothetical protein